MSYLCRWFDEQSNDYLPQSPPMSAASGGAAAGPSGPRPRCCVIATTNRPDDVDARLRRGGRLGLELEVAVTRADRVSLLRSLLGDGCRRLVAAGAMEVSDEAVECMVEKVVELVVDRLGMLPTRCRRCHAVYNHVIPAVLCRRVRRGGHSGPGEGSRFHTVGCYPQ